VLIRWGKQGSSHAGLMDIYAAAVSAGLQHGVPLAQLLRPGLGVSFVPNGRTDDPEIPRARSVVDYLARRLAVDWLPQVERARLGVFTVSERAQQARVREPAHESAPQPRRVLPAAPAGEAARLPRELGTSAALAG